MKKIGLVFGGGGTKGIYHIGMWKAMKDLEIDKKISMVSGTSVGALNAILFALGDYKSAFEIWEKIKASDLLSPNIKGDIKQIEGLCSRSGLTEYINSLNLNKLKTSKVNVYITVKKIDEKDKFNELFPISAAAKDVKQKFSTNDINDIEYYHVNSMSVDDIRTLMLASSAVSLVYDSVHYNDKRYIDAGWANFGNVSIIPLYKNGCKEIYVAPLDDKFNLNKIGKRRHGDFINAEVYFPNCEFTVIKPSKNLGFFLNFDKHTFEKNFKLGESDTSKILKDKLHEENMKLKLQYTQELVKRHKKI